MGRNKFERIYSLVNGNVTNVEIYNSIKQHYDFYEMFSFLLNSLYELLVDVSNREKIDKVIDVLYLLYSDSSFNLDNLSKGNIFSLNKLLKAYSDFITENNLENNEDAIKKVVEMSIKVEEKYKVEEDRLYQVYYKLERTECTLINLNNQISKLLKKSSKKIKEKTFDFNSIKDIMDEMSLSLEKINKDVLHLQNDIIKYGMDENIMSLMDNVLNRLFAAQADFKILVNTTLDTKILEEKVVVNDNYEDVKKIILNLLCNHSCSLEQIHEHLKGYKIYMSLDELHKVLSNINNEVNIIDEINVSIPTMYKICEPTFDTNKVFRLKVADYEKELDLLFISDLHIGKISDELQDDLNAMYEYCINNNISNVINLGDLCSLSSFRLEQKDLLSEAHDIVEDVISKYPRDDGIRNLLMGGNHDKGLFPAGVDPIKQVCRERHDFNNLGYDNAILNISDGDESNYIILHHPDHRIGDETGIASEITDIKKMIKTYYEESTISRDDVLIDFFGHFHKTLLDTSNNYCIIPSFTKDRYMNGAWHVKVFFGKNMNVSNMVFIPVLNIDKKMIKTNEIVYQKKVK